MNKVKSNQSLASEDQRDKIVKDMFLISRGDFPHVLVFCYYMDSILP